MIARRRPRADRAGRRAVQPIPARRRSRAAVPRGRAAGLHRRLPCLGLHRDAARDAARHARGAGARHLVLRRRGRGGPARRGAARRLERHAAAALQLHGRPAGARRRAAADPAAASTCAAPPARCRASISGAAAPTNARSARSSTCRAARAAIRTPDDLETLHPRELRAGHQRGSSSPTTISRATAIGNRCSTA